MKHWSISHAKAILEYSYDPTTGSVIGPSGRKIGHVAVKDGRPGSRRKVRVERDNVSIPIARLIWFLVTGEWPTTLVDHINGDPLDQRWTNLRLATVTENNCNSAQRLGASGYRNVVRGSRGNGWRAEFERKSSGKRETAFVSRQFATPEEAAAVAEQMRPLIRGDYASTRVAK